MSKPPVVGQQRRDGVVEAELADLVALVRRRSEYFDLAPAPSLSIVRRAKPTLDGRTVGILFADGCPRAEVARVKADVESHGGRAARPSTTLDAIALVLTREAAIENEHRQRSGPVL
jgi:hypothetical protein